MQTTDISTERDSLKPTGGKLRSPESSHPSVADHHSLSLLQLQNIPAVQGMRQNEIHLGRLKGLFKKTDIHSLGSNRF